jgi:hypothetical protein
MFIQSVEERFKELENDKTRLDSDKSIYERQLKETEGVRRDLFDKNRVNILFNFSINNKYYFSRNMKNILLI